MHTGYAGIPHSWPACKLQLTTNKRPSGRLRGCTPLALAGSLPPCSLEPGTEPTSRCHASPLISWQQRHGLTMKAARRRRRRQWPSSRWARQGGCVHLQQQCENSCVGTKLHDSDSKGPGSNPEQQPPQQERVRALHKEAQRLNKIEGQEAAAAAVYRELAALDDQALHLQLQHVPALDPGRLAAHAAAHPQFCRLLAPAPAWADAAAADGAHGTASQLRRRALHAMLGYALGDAAACSIQWVYSEAALQTLAQGVWVVGPRPLKGPWHMPWSSRQTSSLGCSRCGWW